MKTIDDLIKELKLKQVKTGVIEYGDKLPTSSINIEEEGKHLKMRYFEGNVTEAEHQKYRNLFTEKNEEEDSFKNVIKIYDLLFEMRRIGDLSEFHEKVMRVFFEDEENIEKIKQFIDVVEDLWVMQESKMDFIDSKGGFERELKRIMTLLFCYEKEASLKLFALETYCKYEDVQEYINGLMDENGEFKNNYGGCFLSLRPEEKDYNEVYGIKI